MFTPWLAAFQWTRQYVPTKPSALIPHFNFITIHYTYLIGMTLLGSIILYPGGEMAYIDALFFASGASTQSGLNTIDVNTIKLYQQVVIMLIACVCNPIFINTFVVFIRLYWFEKRFQKVVLDARTLRRNRTKSRTRSEAKADPQRDIGYEESGVGNREIIVLRQANGEVQGEKIEDEGRFGDMADSSSDGMPSKSGRSEVGGSLESVSPLDHPDASHRGIMFADEVQSPSDVPVSNLERIPERNKEQSIAFVEKQRNPTDKGTLRIPGPRDFDRGFVPQRIEDGDEPLNKQRSNEADDNDGQLRRDRSYSVPPKENEQLKSHITIDVPESRLRPNTGPSAYNRGKVTDAEAEAAPAAAMHLRNRARSKTFGSFMTRTQTEDIDPMPYLSWTPTVGRNSAFVDLTEEQREELGGIEYRALKLLAMILVCYYVGFHLLGMVCLTPWIVRDSRHSSVVIEDGINPVWWGFFTPASMFNDLGFTLNPDSMVSFQFAVLPLILGTFLIIIGNTGFPCMLRFIIWLVSRCVPFGSGVWEELRFLLDHPRRCFTLLFPSNANWWLFWVLILLNGIDLIFFVILDLHDDTVTSLPSGFRFLDGLFQAASTRTAGFAVVNIADLHPAIQVSYLVMMYISIFPIAISLRQTNVYEEKSLGVYASEEDDTENSYLSTHLRRQLSFDLWYVFLGFFLIAIVEGRRLENTNEYAFTQFSVLFEIVSAYGTVGLSLGYPGVNTSFSGQLKPLSKLIIIAMQIRGRHRGLPYALDRAILLPSESLHKKEDEDAIRRARRGSNGTEFGNDGGVGGGLARTVTGMSRRNSSQTADGEAGTSRRIRPQAVRRFLSGALSAGPSVTREKRM